MKQRKLRSAVYLTAAVVLLAAVLSSCGQSAAGPKVDTDRITPTTAPSPAGSVPLPEESVPRQEMPDATKDAVLTEEEVKVLVLQHAGVAQQDVERFWIQLDRDDGREEYELEFRANGVEYDYEVDAVTGAIRSVDYEPERLTPAVDAAVSGIDEEAAKQLALAHAGFTAEQVQRLWVEPDRDDGRNEFDVEFRVDGVEYEYTLDAETGKILSWDSDRDD